MVKSIVATAEARKRVRNHGLVVVNFLMFLKQPEARSCESWLGALAVSGPERQKPRVNQALIKQSRFCRRRE